MVQRLLLTCILCSVLLHHRAHAQPAGLDSLNALFGGSVILKCDKHLQLVIDLYDASGRFRQDAVPLASIDPDRIHFSAEEDAVILECRGGHERCFSKELFKLNTVRLTGRCNLPRPLQDPGGAATIEAFRALLADHLAGATETPLHGARKN
ncbi:MAG: hypothetical protein IPM12_11675 [Flavobacteriales bacterium]|nr:hypothetical protein [Flavobacteriales bacterium]